MKITFAQSDIVAALRAHIVSQGISLDGKAVEIKFTMKKGNAGVAADVSIENAVQLPDLSEPAETPRPVLAVVASTPKNTLAMIATQPVAVEPVVTATAGTAADEPQPEVAQATGTDDAVAEAPTPVKTTSLFN